VDEEHLRVDVVAEAIPRRCRTVTKLRGRTDVSTATGQATKAGRRSDLAADTVGNHVGMQQRRYHTADVRLTIGRRHDTSRRRPRTTSRAGSVDGHHQRDDEAPGDRRSDDDDWNVGVGTKAA
jgi:hypothetical protein